MRKTSWIGGVTSGFGRLLLFIPVAFAAGAIATALLLSKAASTVPAKALKAEEAPLSPDKVAHMTSAQYDQKVRELVASMPEPHVDTTVNTTGDEQYNGARVPRMWVQDWALQRTAAEIRERFGSPLNVFDDPPFKEWVYTNIAAVDPESGSTAFSVKFKLQPDQARGTNIVTAVEFQ